jgi:outer membrane protein assembly factor BamB
MTTQHWPAYLLSTQHNAFVPDRFAPPLRLVWTFERGGYVWGAPIIVQDVVYLLNGLFYALALDTGELLWTSSDWEAVGEAVSPIFWQGHLVAYGIGGIFIVDAHTGALQRHIPSASAVASPCVVHDQVYWHTSAGDLLAADLTTGMLRWSSHLGQGYRCTPSASQHLVYCANLDGVFALDAATGTRRWHWPLANDRTYPEKLKCPKYTLVLDGDTLFLAISLLGVVALDAHTGREQWVCPLDQQGLSTPVIAGDTIYLTHGVVYALNRATGHVRWERNPRDKRYAFTTSLPIVVGDHLYIGGGFAGSSMGMTGIPGSRCGHIPRATWSSAPRRMPMVAW